MVALIDLLAGYVAQHFASVLLPLSSGFSIASLFSALFVAVLVVFARRRPERRNVKYRLMLRVLFPRWWYRNASFRADVGFFLFSVLAFGALFGWAFFSAQLFADIVTDLLIALMGPFSGRGLTRLPGDIAAAVSVFLAYEIGYWIDHYLKHRVGVLWEFHRVHHTAEVLSPLTNFRVHPVDSIVFGNILALSIGTANGVMQYLNIGSSHRGSISVIAVAMMWIVGHLHHSHLWIVTTGLLGRVLLSPAHHQLHHSNDPKHFNKNFGAFLSIWDWLFGTLQVPERRREPLSFGAGPRDLGDHTFLGSFVAPFVSAWNHVARQNGGTPGESA